MPMIQLPKPTQSELEKIETQMRLEAITSQKEPKAVREAKGFEAKQSAWKSEALRFWYLTKKREREGRRTH